MYHSLSGGIHHLYFKSQVSDEHLDDFLKEIGVGMAKRMMAKGIKPRLTITENDGKWFIRSESSLKTTAIDFTPGVEFDETAADGRDVKVDITH